MDGLFKKCLQCKFHFGLDEPFVAGRCALCVDALFALADEVRRGQTVVGILNASTIAKLELKPGDTVLVRLKQRVCKEERARLLDVLGVMFPANKALVLGPNERFKVVRAAVVAKSIPPGPELDSLLDSVGFPPSCSAAPATGEEKPAQPALKVSDELLQGCCCPSALPATLTLTIEEKSYQICLDDPAPAPPAGEEVCKCLNPSLYGHRADCPTRA